MYIDLLTGVLSLIIKKNEIDTILSALKISLPIIQELFPIDFMLGITDLEEFTYYFPGKELDVKLTSGTPIPSNANLRKVFESGEPFSANVPTEVYGVPFKSNALPIKDDDGRTVGVVTMGISLLYQEIPLAYQALNEQGIFIDVNKAWLKMMQYTREEIIGRHFSDFLTLKYAQVFQAKWCNLITVGNFAGFEQEILRKDGSILITSLDGQNTYAANGSYIQTHCVLYDITTRKRQEAELDSNRRELETLNHKLQLINDELYALAATDGLTGTWNRRQFEKTAFLEIEKAKRYNTPISLIIFDIDHFKEINDHHGHNVGDRVLIELSRLVQNNIRATDILARWGGEEFIVLVPNTSANLAMNLAEKLRACIEAHDFQDIDTVTISFGVSEFSYGDILDDWINRADKALYLAKSSGRNTVCLVEAENR